MKTSFSSAGLLYVYITGYKEMELLHIEQIDTYSYIGDELYNKIMEIQQKISNENLKNKIGQEFEVLIEDISFDGKYLIGRTKQDVPDIDGIVYVKNLDKTSLINKFVRVHITDVKNYDLIGKIIE